MKKIGKILGIYQKSLRLFKVGKLDIDRFAGALLLSSGHERMHVQQVCVKGGDGMVGIEGAGIKEREREEVRERKEAAPPWQVQQGTGLAVTPHPRALFN